MIIPAAPAKNAAAATCCDHPIISMVAAMAAAPATPPSVPAAVMAPDVPGAASLPLRIERGRPPSEMPVSVDQVSAAAAAIAPAPAASQVTEPVAIQAIAASANTPPLDITCSASRAPVFERI